MNSDNPHLQASEFNLRRILRERDFGKAAVLVSNLCPNASDPQSIGESSKDNARCELPCGTSSQSDSEDLPDDNETSSEWKVEGHIYFEAGCWPAGKTYEDAVQAAVEEQYLPTVLIHIHHMEMFYNSAAESDRQNRRVDNSGENGYKQLVWSGKRIKRSRAACRCMKRVYLTLKRKLIPEIPTDFF